ncbi:MAG: ral secretion pathway protein [Blastocatellia bacterium]|jgi:general secretion pathway protein D|nr:ral secretion pathway protein [Blastocatellia bacterium]
MRSRLNLRAFLSLLMVVCLLSMPAVALGKKGDDHFKKGLEFEKAQQWEQAAQEFTLAVAANPSNVEYQLHYRRAMFNASQSFMTQGRALAERQDYLGGYNAFRQAFAYDPVNQLAVSEMERMLRLQSIKDGGPATPAMADEAGGTPSSGSTATTAGQEPIPPSTRTEVLRSVIYSGDLKAFIRTMAEQLNLNVIFDRQSFAQSRTIDITLRDVTTAQALDYVFLQEGLFFQKLSRRTVLVAEQTRRAQYQQLVLRTFYLANMKPTDAQRILTAAIPASVGRPQTIVVPDEATNSLTVRDTAENVRLIGELLTSIDKDRAEVVMDVNIYEVSSSDFLQFGNQLGDETSLVTLGGVRSQATTLGTRLEHVILGTGASSVFVPASLGAALILPASSLQALQTKNNTRLIASTQVHAFTGEESTARIGQRVPVQTAQAYPFGVQTGTPQTTGGFPSGGFPVINYEPTGLTLSFTPQVFPNLDVQVKMKIESKDVLGASTLTPTFTERTITGTARVQNNRTMLLASVSQDVQANGRKGFPLLGLIPVLGRLFTAPTKDNRRVDIVIAVTPRVLRAPAVTPRDEQMRPSGTLQSPTTGSLEAMLRETETEDRLAEIAAARVEARKIPTNAVVQLPDVEPPPAYIAAPKALAPNTTVAANNTPATVTQNGATKTATVPAVVPAEKKDIAANAPSPIDTSATPAYVQRPTDLPSAIKNLSGGNGSVSPTTSAATNAALVPVAENLAPNAGTNTKPSPDNEAAKRIVELTVTPQVQELRLGEKSSTSIGMVSDAPLGLAVIALRFDPRVLKITNISPGALFAGATTLPTITKSIDEKGMLVVSITAGPGSGSMIGQGPLLKIDFEAVGAGDGAVSFDTGNVHLIAADGRSLVLQLGQSVLTVKQ